VFALLDISIERTHNASFGYIASVTAILDVKFNDDNLLSIKSQKIGNILGSLVDMVSGEAFRIAYSPEKRFESAFVYFKNPLILSTSSFGYSYYYIFNVSSTDFYKTVKEQLQTEIPVIATYPLTKSLVEWGIIKDLSSEKIVLTTFTGEKQLSINEHKDYLEETLWYTLDNKEPVKAKSHLFFITKKRRDVEKEGLFELAIKRARFLYYLPKITFNGIAFSAGEAAFNEIIEDLRRERNYWKLKKEELLALSKWNGTPFVYLWRKLESINNFIQILQNFYTGKEQKAIKKALQSSENALKFAAQYHSALSFDRIHDNILGNEKDLVMKITDPERRETGILTLRQIKDALSSTLVYMEDII